MRLRRFALGMFGALAMVGMTLSAARGSAAILYHEDGEGNWVGIDTETAPTQKTMPTYSLMAGNITWNVTYVDVTSNNNLGFDDSVQGPARQNVLNEVLTYLNTQLYYTATIDIQVNASDNNGLPGPFAAFGTSFFPTSGFTNGICFTHIITGSDPVVGQPDIQGRVHFGFTYHTDTTTPPGPAEYDLFSVLLHELTHGLGLGTLATATGAGAIPGARNTLTVWDDYIKTGANFDIWSGFGTFNGPTSNLISNNLFFTGPKARLANGGVNPQIYAPSAFASGTSIGHYNTGVASSMVPTLVNGAMQRTHTSLDSATLEDLGYRIGPPPNAGRDWMVFE